MATITNNILVDGISGKFGKQLVFRTLRGKTFVSPAARKPSKKKESEAQRNTRVNFREATEWARRILRDPEKKAYYKQRAKALKLPNAYTAVITDYMRKPKVVKLQNRDTITYSIHKPGFTIKQVQVMANEATAAIPQKVAISQHKDTWFVNYNPEDETASLLTLIIIDNALQKIKFVDVLI
ncbi:MAG: hypothetical protein ABI663_03410 [Chryseolinea sp.]